MDVATRYVSLSAMAGSSIVRSDVRTGRDVSATYHPDEHPRLDWLLDNWARWHRVRNDYDQLNCKTTTWWAGNYDTDRETDRVEIGQAEVLEALVWSHETPDTPYGLRLSERGAVIHVHLGAVFRFARLDLMQCYNAARGKLSVGLLKRHVP